MQIDARLIASVVASIGLYAFEVRAQATSPPTRPGFVMDQQLTCNGQAFPTDKVARWRSLPHAQTDTTISFCTDDGKPHVGEAAAKFNDVLYAQPESDPGSMLVTVPCTVDLDKSTTTCCAAKAIRYANGGAPTPC